MGWAVFWAFVLYGLIGVGAAAPFASVFDLDLREDAIGVLLVFTWPLWLGAAVLVIWLALSPLVGSPTHHYRVWKQRTRSVGDPGTASEAQEQHSHGEQPQPRASDVILTKEERRIDLQRRIQVERERREGAAAARAAARAASRGPRSGIAARVPKDADDFESVRAEWLQRCGAKAERTAKGPDGGLDIIGPNIAGQCKFHPANKVGAPDIQRLAGAAAQAGKPQMHFFHFGPGYTEGAKSSARRLGVRLWVLDVEKVEFKQVE